MRYLVFAVLLACAACAGTERQQAAVVLDQLRHLRAISRVVDGATPAQAAAYGEAWDGVEHSVAVLATPSLAKGE